MTLRPYGKENSNRYRRQRRHWQSHGPGAQKGYNVVITGRNRAAGEAVVQELRALGGQAVFKPVDICQQAEVIQLVEETVQQFGRLDAFVNNAGISGKENGLLADCSAENFRDLLETNVLGLFYGMKYAIQAMLKTGGGAIVNLASIAGANGIPYAAQYCSSKHTVVGLTKSAAVEYELFRSTLPLIAVASGLL